MQEEVDTVQARAKLRKTVMNLISRGQVRRARLRAKGDCVASMSVPEVRATMESKYPPRSAPLPDSVSEGTYMWSPFLI